LILEVLVSFFLVILSGTPIHYTSAQESDIIPIVSGSQGTLSDTKSEDTLSSTTLAIGDEPRAASFDAEAAFVYKDPVLCSCVQYIKSKGYNTTGRNAGDFVPNAFTPQIGDLAVFQYPNGAHVAYVEETYLGSFKISETNYKRCTYTERIIMPDDKALKGFVHQVQ